jgi:kynurenine formamidase
MKANWAVLGSAVVVAGLTLAAWPFPRDLKAVEQAPPSQFAALARTPTNASEFDQLFRKVSNWGRWGNDDQLGAANLITDAKRRQAAALVKAGVSVSLSHAYLTEKALDNPNPFEHVMGKTLTSDTFRISYHGAVHSHMDGLCHYLYQDRTYNGYPRETVNTEKGCLKLGIQNLKNGIVTRGILLDIPRLKGVPYLEPGTPVFVEDLEAWERKAGVKVASGDVIFLRTGRWARRASLGPWDVAATAAGFHASVVPWIKERDVSFVGTDSVTDLRPNLVEGVRDPVHTLLIAGLGVDIFDNLDLEALAETAARLNRWEFMLTVAPLAVVGATGSPTNPLAIF